MTPQTAVRASIDTLSYDEFYLAHRSAVLKAVYLLCGDRMVAEELTQEAFIRAFRRWARVTTLDRPDLWVRRVALNLAISNFRRVRAETSCFARSIIRPAATLDEVGVTDDTRTVLDAVRRLPRRQGQAVVLHYFEGLMVQEVAQVMGCTAGAVKAHLHAARRNLRTAIGGADDD